MHIARRLYLYLLSGIGLAVGIVGLRLLLTALFDQLGLSAGEVLVDPDRVVRERLTLATALTAVALPVWLIHWWVAERSLRPTNPRAAEERSSAVRALYLSLVLGALLITIAVRALSLIETVVLGLTGEPLGQRAVADDLALLIIAGLAWGYHLLILLRDRRQQKMVGAAAWLPRAYLYLAAVSGLLMMLFGISDLLRVIQQSLVETPVALIGGWWTYPLANAVAGAVVGAVGWGTHWWYANQLWADAGWRGESERHARLRLAYYVAVLVATATAGLALASEAIRDGIEALLGVGDWLLDGRLAGAMAAALASAIVFGLACWLHVRWLEREAEAEAATAEAAPRLRSYPLAQVGLAFGATGAAWLIGLAIDVLFGGRRTVVIGSTWETELAQFVPFALLGTALWSWQWFRIEARYAADPEHEAASTMRRTVLLIVLAATIVGAISSVGLILYRVFGSLFGVALSGNAISELSTPIGVLIVVVAVAAYHAMLLRRDQAKRGLATRVATGRTVMLRLSAPADADVQQLLAVLRGKLPPDHQLDQVASNEQHPLRIQTS